MRGGLPTRPANLSTAAQYERLAREAARLAREHENAGRISRAQVAWRDVDKYKRAAKKYEKK